MHFTLTSRMRVAIKLLLALLALLLSAIFFGLCLPQFIVRRLLPSLGLLNIFYVVGGGIIGLVAGGFAAASLRRTDGIVTRPFLLFLLTMAALILATMIIATYTEGVLVSL